MAVPFEYRHNPELWDLDVWFDEAEAWRENELCNIEEHEHVKPTIYPSSVSWVHFLEDRDMIELPLVGG